MSERTVQVEPASPMADLRDAPPAVRFLTTAVLSAAGAYFACFGLVAILGRWRGSLLSPTQLGIIVSLLGVQLTIAWLLKLRPIAGAAVFAALWSVPWGIMILSASGANDFPDFLYAMLMPGALSFANSALAGRLFAALDLPLSRGERIARHA